MADAKIPSLMDDQAFLDELGRLDAKPHGARPQVGHEHVARLDRNMPPLAAGGAQPYDAPQALLAGFEADVSIANGRGEERSLAPVLMIGLAAGAAAAAFVLRERLAWIFARVW